jgi:hypothetical protein
MPQDIRLNKFAGGPSDADPKAYVVITTKDKWLTGPWARTAATLQGFPSSGRWIYVPDAGGVVLEDGDGKLVCTLEGLVPGSTDQVGMVDVVLTDALPYGHAQWNLQT